MPAALTADPTAGLVVLVIAVLAVAAVVSVLVILRRSMRLSALTIGVSAFVAIAIVAGAAIVGGTLVDRSPTAGAERTAGIGSGQR